MLNVMGASVRGPGHQRDGCPNQDAWIKQIARGYALAVVCDGLGSRPHSAFGARAACRAVADAVKLWEQSKNAPTDLLLRLIHTLWNIRVHTLGRDDCATTCLFAVAKIGGPLVLAQLGDGLVMLINESGSTTLEPPESRFGNMTTGLGIASDLREWQVHVDPCVTDKTVVLLATDGVADDLMPEKRDEFLRYLVESYGSLPPVTRSKSLAKALRAWPTPNHSDDKSVALLWNDNYSTQMEKVT